VLELDKLYADIVTVLDWYRYRTVLRHFGTSPKTIHMPLKCLRPITATSRYHVHCADNRITRSSLTDSP